MNGESQTTLLTSQPQCLVTPKEQAGAASSLQVETYSPDEIKLLYRYATPFERVALLLGLNCGFGAGELATLGSVKFA